MSDIQPYTASQSPVPARTAGGRLARQTSRQLATIEQASEVRQAAIVAAADIQAAKAEAVARTGAYAMQQAALVSQMQTQLALAAPAASGDLDYLKTITTMALGQVVTDTLRQVNR